jgi:riboflavin synthase
MFTGIVEAIGEVEALRPQPGGARLSIRVPEEWTRPEIGASLAVNGACLTLVAWEGPCFSADLTTETLQRTTFGSLRPGDRVNLERPLTLGAMLGGHLVTGHVDGIGTVVAHRPEGGGSVMRLRAPAALAPLLVYKGSIAVDGVSLTVADLAEEDFSVALIPYTLQHTTLGERRPGNAVNLEADLLGKYVARLLGRLDRLPTNLLAGAGEETGR